MCGPWSAKLTTPTREVELKYQPRHNLCFWKRCFTTEGYRLWQSERKSKKEKRRRRQHGKEAGIDSQKPWRSTYTTQASSQEHRQPKTSSSLNLQIKPLPPFPSQKRRPSHNRLCKSNDAPPPEEPLLPETLSSALDAIGRVFQHVPYAVAGVAAMAAHGYRARQPRHVSVVCPSSARAVLASWVASAGHSIKVLDGADVASELCTRVSTPAAPEGTRRVRTRVCYLARGGFENLVASGVVRYGTSRTVLLGLPGLVDRLARQYVEVQGPRFAYLAGGVANDLFWLLREVGAARQRSGMGALMLGPERLQHVWDPLFWHVFTAHYPGAVALFARAGLVAPELMGGDGEGDTDVEGTDSFGGPGTDTTGTETPETLSLRSLLCTPRTPRTPGLTGTPGSLRPGAPGTDASLHVDTQDSYRSGTRVPDLSQRGTQGSEVDRELEIFLRDYCPELEPDMPPDDAWARETYMANPTDPPEGSVATCLELQKIHSLPSGSGGVQA